VEVWKPAPGFETSHEVSNHGRIRSIDRHVTTPKGTRRCRGQVLKIELSGSGYPSIKLWRGGSATRQTIHKLVALAFLGDPPGKVGCRKGEYNVNHKDGDKTNNHISNLEWILSEDNRAHAMANGLILCGARHPSAKLSEKDVRDIRRQYARRGCTLDNLAERYSITKGHIRQIIQRKAWKSVA